MRLIVTSQTDIAGSNVYEMLAEDFGFEEDGEFEGKPIYKRGDVWLIATEKRQTEANHLDEFFEPDYYVFASRHKSESEEKTLTVHVTGNLTDEAAVGGRPGELAYSSPDAMKAALGALEEGRKRLGLDYKVSMEATHHGPSELERPVLFVEVGSTEAEWRDERAVLVVAEAALKAAENREKFTHALGIGGNHYAPIHTKAILETDVAIGHIIPAYAILSLKKEVFIQAIEKTGAEFGFLDWKGMKKEHRSRIKNLASGCGLELKRGKDIKSAPGCPGFEIEAEFFHEAEKACRKIIADAIEENGGLVTTESSGRLSNRISMPHLDTGRALDGEGPAKLDIQREVIRACVKALEQKYEMRFDGRLILKEKKLDMEKAKKLGIKPGPVLGKIVMGQTVEIDGRTVTKDMLVKEETKILEINGRITAEVIKEFLIDLP